MTLVRFFFKNIEPDNADSDLEYFGKMMLDLAAELLSSGPLGVLQTLWETTGGMILEDIFGGGGYYSYVMVPPDERWRTVGIRWANVCAGPYDDVPVSYVTTITVFGPEAIIDKL